MNDYLKLISEELNIVLVFSNLRAIIQCQSLKMFAYKIILANINRHKEIG